MTRCWQGDSRATPDQLAGDRPLGPGRARRARRRGGGAAALAACLALWSTAEGVSRAPVPLRTPQVFTPVETAGTGLAPEVKLRATIDERGRVSEVEVLSIEPTSEYDGLFAAQLRDTVQLWRYAPALRDGTPVATELEWRLQFKAREGRPSRSQPALEGRLLRRPPPATTPEEQRKLLGRYTQLAEQFLEQKHRKRLETPHVVVVSDAEDPETAARIAGDLEATFAVLDDILAAEVAPQPRGSKLVVYAYARRSAFVQLQATLGAYEWVEGLYRPPGFLAIHLNHRSEEALLHALLHEACHAYADRRLTAPGLELPEWIAEGFAEYVASSRIKKGELIPGRTLKSEALLDPLYGVYEPAFFTESQLGHPTRRVHRRTTETGSRLEEVQRAMREGRGLEVEQLLLGKAAPFYGAKHPLYHQTAWLLVHFLRHGEEGWEERFPTLLLYAAEGYPARAALEAVYGVRAAELEAPFREYVRRF